MKIFELLMNAITSILLVSQRYDDSVSGNDYMKSLNTLMAKSKTELQLALWKYETNITEYNKQVYQQVVLKVAKERKKYWKATMSYKWHEFEDLNLRRMFQKYSELGNSALPEEQGKRLLSAINNMKENYAKAMICDYKDRTKCDLHVEPDVTQIFATSNDPEELKYAWLEWHKAAGAPSRGNFTDYVAMANEAAKLNGYASVAEWWLSKYEATDIEDQFSQLWANIKPLYLQLHAYVRRQLRLKYGDVVSMRGPIPAHLLGNIWAQDWTHLVKFTRPYPDKPDVDVTAALIAQNYTALKIFKTAEEFFTSLNLSSMPQLFWDRSIIDKPSDGRDMVCHPSAWDFSDGEDFRIKQCTMITDEFLQTTHHEMGHVQYFLQYKDQPNVFRDGANPGFHEAIGDVMSLSVMTSKHLRKIGLLKDGLDDLETNINQLYQMAVKKIVVFSNAYSLELFRYKIFRGTTTSDNYNCHYWQFRESFQGIEPPVPRSEDDFDPAAKLHISANTECMRYYVAHIIQFQFHRALCQLAGEYNTKDSSQLLSNCDIYKSVEAGNALGKMLQLGSSKLWPEAMEVLTGTRNMDASGVLEYFKPLHDWLKAENERTGEFIGWEPSTVQYCTAKQRSSMEN